MHRGHSPDLPREAFLAWPRSLAAATAATATTPREAASAERAAAAEARATAPCGRQRVAALVRLLVRKEVLKAARW